MRSEDELYRLRKAAGDLFSVHAVIELAEGNPGWAAEKDVLRVIRRSVVDVAGSIEEIADVLEEREMRAGAAVDPAGT